MSLDLSISIVTYKEDPNTLREVISSVMGSDLSLKLYLVDNSPNTNLKSVLPADPRVHYIHLPENPGFGKAHNTAIRLADQRAPYHLVLNPDVAFDPSILRGMTTFLSENPKVGLLAPKVAYPNGDLQPLCKLLPTPADVLLRRLLPNSAWVRRRNRRYELKDNAYNRLCRIPSVSGCFMLFRTSSLWTAGLFDEKFFMYFEDIDLSRRIAMSSEAIFSPDFQITHHYGKGSYRSLKLLKIHIASAIYYFNKWGWLYDPARKSINRETLEQFK